MSSVLMTDRFERSEEVFKRDTKLLNSFAEKRNLEASCVLIRTRSEHAKVSKKKKEIESLWDQKPVDLTWKLYHPHPPKRNTREAIKPWTYDKYLRQLDELEIAERTSKAKPEKTPLINNLFKPGPSEESADEDSGKDYFKVDPRVDTPGGARMKAAKEMGFRDGLDMYTNPKPHDFRGLKFLYGMPNFKTRFEKDPFNIKFLSENLPQIHGLQHTISLREVDPSLQMGDLVKKAEPYYDPNLILPRLPFPNKFYGYTRHRPLVRSVTSAFWDRALPKLNEQWESQKSHSKHKRPTPPPSSPAPSPASSTLSLASSPDSSI